VSPGRAPASPDPQPGGWAVGLTLHPVVQNEGCRGDSKPVNQSVFRHLVRSRPTFDQARTAAEAVIAPGQVSAGILLPAQHSGCGAAMDAASNPTITQLKRAAVIPQRAGTRPRRKGRRPAKAWDVFAKKASSAGHQGAWSAEGASLDETACRATVRAGGDPTITQVKRGRTSFEYSCGSRAPRRSGFD
jgi:hypothetical protein